MIIVLSLLLVVILTSCVPHRVPVTEPRTSYLSGKGQRYVVREGDTLWRISKKYGVGVARIISENEISSAEDLGVGQTIFIPPRSGKKRYSKTADSSFDWPVKGEVINLFGESTNNVMNKGINIKTSAVANVKASAEGEVVFFNYLKGWGQTLILKHPGNIYTIYANLTDVSVKEGTFVNRGDAMARVALASGERDGILHFEVRKQYLPQNPLNYLK